MNKIQRLILRLYLLITCLALLFDWLFPASLLIRSFKFIAMVVLLILALQTPKSYSEQKALTGAILFMLLGDFLLGFGHTLNFLAALYKQLGMLGYCLSYLILNYVYSRNFKMNKYELGLALPILIVFIIVFYNLAPFVEGVMFIATIIFGLVLSSMTWNAIGTIFRGYYHQRVSRLMALSGILIFISDIAVANSLFNPAFNQMFVPWLENIIWVTFIPAWVLITIALKEPNFITDQTVVSP